MSKRMALSQYLKQLQSLKTTEKELIVRMRILFENYAVNPFDIIYADNGKVRAIEVVLRNSPALLKCMLEYAQQNNLSVDFCETALETQKDDVLINVAQLATIIAHAEHQGLIAQYINSTDGATYAEVINQPILGEPLAAFLLRNVTPGSFLNNLNPTNQDPEFLDGLISDITLWMHDLDGSYEIEPEHKTVHIVMSGPFETLKKLFELGLDPLVLAGAQTLEQRVDQLVNDPSLFKKLVKRGDISLGVLTLTDDPDEIDEKGRPVVYVMAPNPYGQNPRKFAMHIDFTPLQKIVETACERRRTLNLERGLRSEVNARLRAHSAELKAQEARIEATNEAQLTRAREALVKYPEALNLFHHVYKAILETLGTHIQAAATGGLIKTESKSETLRLANNATTLAGLLSDVVPFPGVQFVTSAADTAVRTLQARDARKANETVYDATLNLDIHKIALTAAAAVAAARTKLDANAMDDQAHKALAKAIGQRCRHLAAGMNESTAVLMLIDGALQELGRHRSLESGSSSSSPEQPSKATLPAKKPWGIRRLIA